MEAWQILVFNIGLNIDYLFKIFNTIVNYI